MNMTGIMKICNISSHKSATDACTSSLLISCCNKCPQVLARIFIYTTDM